MLTHKAHIQNIINKRYRSRLPWYYTLEDFTQDVYEKLLKYPHDPTRSRATTYLHLIIQSVFIESLRQSNKNNWCHYNDELDTREHPHIDYQDIINYFSPYEQPLVEHLLIGTPYRELLTLGYPADIQREYKDLIAEYLITDN